MTPEVICSDVEKLIEKLNCNTELVYVDCYPEGGEMSNCFPIVEKRIQKSGGSQVLGWAIWKINVLVQAEFHAVWKTSEGDLMDISPRVGYFKRILFVPDPKAKYEGKQVDNIRINISSNEVVNDHIEVCESIFKIENKGDRAYQHRLELKGKEACTLKILRAYKPMLIAIALQGFSHQGTCFCGSGEKYKDCHRPLILETARSI